MKWTCLNDITKPIITAEKRIVEQSGNAIHKELPETCVIFEMGMALPFIEIEYSARTIYEKLPDVCFVQGGYGAPAAVEASALMTVSKYYDIPAVTLLICSDKHPLHEGDEEWYWGNCGFKEKRKQFVRDVIE